MLEQNITNNEFLEIGKPQIVGEKVTIKINIWSIGDSFYSE